MTIDDREPRTPGEHRSMTTPPPSRRTSRDLERYAGLFAARTKVMRSSAMRDLMALTERKDVISLAGGLPDTASFPAESFAAIMSRVAVDSCARSLQYGPTEGLTVLKTCIAEVMEEEGTHVDPDEVLVTTGGQQVIDLVCKTLIDPGDVIIAEAPTYPGAVPTFCSYQAEVIQIDGDDDGMRIDLLEETLERLAGEGRRPKFIYTVPTFQNPSGTTMSLARRHRLIQVIRERELLVLEDNPYGLLRYEGDPLPTLYSMDGGNFVIYLGTFSKILSPGVRLGWSVGPRPVLDKMNVGKQAADLCSSSLTQFFVAAYFASGRWQDYVHSLKEIYRRRRDVMLDALAECFGRECSWTHPQGGLFIWATLPDYIDTTDLLARALDENVAFVPGRAAFLDGRGANSMRLNFSGVGEADIREGIRRIGEVVREQISLYERLTGSSQTAPPAAEPRPAELDIDLANVLHLPAPERRRRAGGSEIREG
jgi:2-aminoadipate transaminase